MRDESELTWALYAREAFVHYFWQESTGGGDLTVEGGKRVR